MIFSIVAGVISGFKLYLTYKKGYMKANGMAIHTAPAAIRRPAIHLKTVFIFFR